MSMGSIPEPGEPILPAPALRLLHSSSVLPQGDPLHHPLPAPPRWPPHTGGTRGPMMEK